MINAYIVHEYGYNVVHSIAVLHGLTFIRWISTLAIYMLRSLHRMYSFPHICPIEVRLNVPVP